MGDAGEAVDHGGLVGQTGHGAVRPAVVHDEGAAAGAHAGTVEFVGDAGLGLHQLAVATLGEKLKQTVEDVSV